MTAIALAAAFACAGCSRDTAAVAKEHLARGDGYAKNGRYREAAVEYQGALQADPRSGAAYRKLGDVLLKLGEGGAARQAYVRAADLLPDDNDVVLMAGTLRLLGHQFEDARALADKVLARSPENVRALVLRANALAGLEDLDTAISQLRQAIQLEPGHADLYANLAAVEARSGRSDEAEAAFKRAIAADPGSAAAHAALGNFYWATGRITDAERAFLDAVRAQPKDVSANRALGMFYLASGRPAEAEPFMRAVADLADDVNARIALADYYLLTGRQSQGLEILESVAKTPEGFLQATSRLAAAAYAGGRPDAAHQMVADMLARSPNSPVALLLNGRFLLKEGKEDEALASVQKALEGDPTLVPGLYLLGQIYQDRRSYDRAEAAYKKILELNPLAAPANLQLARLNLARGEVDTSLQYAESAVKNAPNDPAARLALVRALVDRRDVIRAEAELAPLRRQYPKAAAVLTLAGTLGVLKRDYPGARRAFEAALASDPRSIDALSGLVAAELGTGQPAAARARVEAAVSRDPRDIDLILLQARVYGATRDMARAEATLRHAIDLDSNSLEAYGMLGQFYYEQGRLDDGRRQFEQIVAKEPNAVAAGTMLAIILKRQGRIDEAAARYKQVLAIDPNAAVAANNLAWIYATRNQNLEEGVMLARTARKFLPDRPEVGDTLGWLYVRSGSPALGVPYLEECVRNAPGNALFHYHLGAAYAAARNREQARIQLQEALKLDAKFDGADDAARILESLKK